VGDTYRTKAVPRSVTNAQLGQWYLNSPNLRGDSTHHNSNGNSVWPTWVIHQNPRDVNAKFVARLFVRSGMPTPLVVTGDTLEEVRNALPGGLKRWEADPRDRVGTTKQVFDPVQDGFVEERNTLVESWGPF